MRGSSLWPHSPHRRTVSDHNRTDISEARNEGCAQLCLSLTRIISVKPSFRQVLCNTPFSLLWGGQLVSRSGDFIFDVAAIRYVLQLAGDPFEVGVAVATILLPAIFIGLLQAYILTGSIGET